MHTNISEVNISSTSSCYSVKQAKMISQEKWVRGHMHQH